jgi:hypothetical protein
MKLKLFYLAGALLMVSTFLSCSDDEDPAPIEGVWQSTSLKGKFYPKGSSIAVYEETISDFDVLMELRADGTATVETNDGAVNGTWQYSSDKKKIIPGGDMKLEFFEAEAFNIVTLTKTTLVLSFTYEGLVDVPDLGGIEGKVEFTLNFTRVE